MEFWMMLSESQVPNKEHRVAVDVIVAGSKILNTHHVPYVCFIHLFMSINFFFSFDTESCYLALAGLVPAM